MSMQDDINGWGASSVASYSTGDPGAEPTSMHLELKLDDLDDFFEKANGEFIKLRSDRTAWAEELRERSLWEEVTS